MLTDNELGVGDFVRCKNIENEKYLIVSKITDKIFELLSTETGKFIKVPVEDCIHFESKRNL